MPISVVSSPQLRVNAYCLNTISLWPCTASSKIRVRLEKVSMRLHWTELGPKTSD